MNPKEKQHWKVLILLLKEVAIDKGITQQQIADRTGLQKSNVSRVFTLKYKPNLELFLNLAQAVGVYFFFEDKDGNSDLAKCFQRAMNELGRRTDDFPMN